MGRAGAEGGWQVGCNEGRSAKRRLCETATAGQWRDAEVECGAAVSGCEGRSVQRLSVGWDSKEEGKMMKSVVLQKRKKEKRKMKEAVG